MLDGAAHSSERDNNASDLKITHLTNIGNTGSSEKIQTVK